MTNLAEFQFELLPSEAATSGQVFGIGSEISANEDGFHPGSTSWSTQDSQSAATGVTLFGKDVLTGPVWAWDLHVNRDDCDNAVDSLGKFMTAWRALHIRKTPGLVIPLRYQLAGRTRRIYGRPGQAEASVDNLLLSGFAPITCDFQAVDGFTYDDTYTQVAVGVGAADVGAVGGGFVFPLKFPYKPAAASQTAVPDFLVGGDAPAHPIIRFTGPWDGPGLATEDWTLSFPNYTLFAGQYIEVDTRPWVNTVMLNGVASVGGAMGRRQRLTDMVLQPGQVATRVLGSSPTGAGGCTVRWVNAHNSI